MLRSLFNRLFQRSVSGRDAANASTAMTAADIMAMADRHAAITKLRALLEKEPTNLDALNNLGACHADIGNAEEASRLFELAYSLDDSYIPAIVNHANLLVERRMSTQALPFLEEVKVADPAFGQADLVYARLCFVRGDLAAARHFQLKAWLSLFDNLRYADGHLWYALYDTDESLVAAEHKFWAETLRPIEPIAALELETAIDRGSVTEVDSDVAKIRIGYWSPDFVSHSVRYFARPLIQNHDRSKVEIFAYHDLAKQDEHTQHIRSHVDHFHDVHTLNDTDLTQLIVSHQLDVLVELAGHTSYNRLPLLQQRLAKVQITALGYPPTTGLHTIDAKIVDKHIMTVGHAKHYAESPLVLPHSFWCFDPMEDATIDPRPPVDRNGYVTFACVGNVSKMNQRMLQCWKVILDRVPSSKLLVRSATFSDAASLTATQTSLLAAGIAQDRLDLRLPEGGRAFFESYNEIDIVLDTFPFNGGTTTCFATYMGVPVISLVGSTLASRMGLSILKNLQIGDLAVHDDDAYITRAIEVSSNPDFLRSFRSEARQRYQQSSLGNGKMFAADFEEACGKLLVQKRRGELNYCSEIPALPANEIIKRAYVVMQHGQYEAAQRILQHCLRHYPHAGAAHLLVAQQWTKTHQYEEAISYLLGQFSNFAEAEKISATICLSRLYLLLGDKNSVSQQLAGVDIAAVTDGFDRSQLQLFSACCRPQSVQANEAIAPLRGEKSIHLLLVCDDLSRYTSIEAQIKELCICPADWNISFSRCAETAPQQEYQRILSNTSVDVLVIMQKNIEICRSDFWIRIVDGLTCADVISFAGARTWDRIDWRAEPYVEKAAGFITQSFEDPKLLELQWAGIESGALCKDMVVLDGALLAVKPYRVSGVAFDDKLEGDKTLLEEDWVHTLFLADRTLAVSRALGVKVSPNDGVEARDRISARVALCEKYHFNIFDMRKDDFMLASVPVASNEEAFGICDSMEQLSEAIPN